MLKQTLLWTQNVGYLRYLWSYGELLPFQLKGFQVKMETLCSKFGQSFTSLTHSVTWSVWYRKSLWIIVVPTVNFYSLALEVKSWEHSKGCKWIHGEICCRRTDCDYLQIILTRYDGQLMKLTNVSHFLVPKTVLMTFDELYSMK